MGGLEGILLPIEYGSILQNSDEGGFLMDSEDKPRGETVGPLKNASAQRLVGKLEAAYRNGMLKPVNPSAKPTVEEIRVKSK